MKTFSKTWNKSKDKSKQKKFMFNAPLHIKRNMLSSNLSKDLREKYTRRSFPVVVGDKVKAIAGSFKGKTGKVTTVDVKNHKVYLDIAYTMKKSGAKSFYPIDSSNLMIVELNLKDSVREKKLSGKGKTDKLEKKAKPVKAKAESTEKAKPKKTSKSSKEE